MKLPKLPLRAEILLDCLLCFLFTAALIRPFFLANYTAFWGSIESTFIADGRFLAAHWPHPQWQPLWYTGTRFDYIYPPALRYGTAIISMVTGFWPVKAYHFYVSFFYACGIAGVYLLVRVASQSRGVALWSAAATALMSPSLVFLANMRHDAYKLTPVRLGVLVKYGEGPHITSVACLPFALAFIWLAFEWRRPHWIALAAVSCAAVVSNNFYGATSLAMFYPILLWSFWVTRPDRRLLFPALAIPALAYGLTAFWLSPSYIHITAVNMQYVSAHGNNRSVKVALLVAAVFAIASYLLARGRPRRTWPLFAAGSLVFFSLNVLGNYYFNFRISGEPGRLIPELDMVIILAFAALLGWLWTIPGRASAIVVALVLAGAFYTTTGYLRHAWEIFPLDPDYRARVEYRITDWLYRNIPNARVYPAGSIRFWFDTWHDLAEMGGGSEQGLMNAQVMPAQWEILLGPEPGPGVLWLQDLGVDAVVVSGPKSQEVYKDFQAPQKFAGTLPVLYDDGKGNTIYGIPRRYPVRARVVETAALNAVGAPRSNTDVESLLAYNKVIEAGPEAEPKVQRLTTDLMLVRANFAPGQSLVVQETYDRAWHAWAGGQALPVHRDAMGMMAIDAVPGAQEIRVEFVTPLENQIGRVITLATLLALVLLVIKRR